MIRSLFRGALRCLTRRHKLPPTDNISGDGLRYVEMQGQYRPWVMPYLDNSKLCDFANDHQHNHIPHESGQGENHD